MRFALTLAFQNERHWLKLYLPLHMQADIDGLIALDGGSTDGGADLLREHGATVIERKFDWNFAEHINFLHHATEEMGYDALLWLSPDELMFPEGINNVRRMLETYDLLQLPRHNFEELRTLHMPQLYPDSQWRAWRTGLGIRKIGVVHETIHPKTLVRVNWTAYNEPIYHYEGIRRDHIEREYKHAMYAALRTGGDQTAVKRRKRLPKNYKPIWRERAPFEGQQPLDPQKIGKCAPWKCPEETDAI